MRPLQENDVFHAIAHPARRQMLQALKAGECPAAELARPFDITFSAISQHLKILKEAQLVTERREGRHRLYQLRTEPLQEIHAWAEDFRVLWSARLDALEAHLDRKHPQQ
ncbi:MAG TPA: metalloregulator ArsR/SmtB family transcription factor [Candidatus Limnocylindria bacterium]|nr:metalloregulator ArsR/SmtB family transcription factor [Candidatus Limnocylindria bacterium]